MTLAQIILVLQAVSSVFLAGLICFVQVVHYPLFARVGKDEFTAYAREHAIRTGKVVILPMLVEAACTFALLYLAWTNPTALGEPALPARLLAAGGFILVLLIWLSTFLLQVPCHRRLAQEHDPAVIRRLVRSNYLRSVGWLLRALLAITWLVFALLPGK